MNISIRRAKPEDAEAILHVFYKTWLFTYPNDEVGVTVEDIEKKYENSFTSTSIFEYAEKLKNLPKTTIFLVAIDELENKIVGLCRIFLHETFNQLQAIYVLPEYQSQGVGTALWQESVSLLDNTKDSIVHVATYNKNAISFYEKLGFVDTGKRFQEEKHVMPISGVSIPEMELIIKKQLN